MDLNGWDLLPADCYSLATVLPTTEHTLTYTYDLGAHWYHDIVVSEILPADKSTGRIQLLAGRGACPAEDFGGNMFWNDVILAKVYHQNAAAYAPLHHEIAESENYSKAKGVECLSWRYDPEAFDLEAARDRVKDTVRNPHTTPRERKREIVPVASSTVPGVGTLYLGVERGGGGIRGGKMVLGTNRRGREHSEMLREVLQGLGPSVPNTTAVPTPEPDYYCCQSCGSVRATKKCIRCQEVAYCNHK